MIYLDNAATTKLCPEAKSAMLDVYERAWGNPSSAHSFGRAALKALETAREDIAEVLGVSPKTVYFTSGGTESNNLAMRQTAGLKICSVFEHPSVLKCADKTCPTDAFELENASLAALMSVNNETGQRFDVFSLSRECAKRGILFHCDAVADERVPDLSRIGSLSLSAHKFGGPPGIGILYSKREPAPIIAGGSQERGARAGTQAAALAAGMAAALKARRPTDPRLVKCLAEGLTGLGAEINFAGEHIVNARFAGFNSDETLILLDRRGICASAGAACAAGAAEPSRVLTAMGLSKQAASESVRFSLSAGNTEEEIATVLETVKLIIKR